MKQGHGEKALCVVALVAFSACADPANRIAGPKTSSADVQTGADASPATPERAALTRVARLVAVALDNEPARQQLKRDMRAAPFREHKLELGPYLRSREGAALVARMVASSGGSESELFSTLNSIRRLEFYMPVAKQRESWTGAGEVLVVSQLDESEPIVSFDSRGLPVTLDRNIPPNQPALSIVPVETRFDQPMGSATSRNARDDNGNAIGTLEPLSPKVSKMIACGEECGGGTYGGGAETTIDPGLYLEFSRILDMKEPWFRGDAEIEVHIQGPRDSRTPAYGDDLSCSGEHAGDYRKVFDQNTGFWQGRVLLYGADEIKAYAAKFNDQGFHIFFWEDDNDSCLLKLDSSVLLQLVRSTLAAFGSVATKVAYPTAPGWLIATVFIASLFTDSGAWLLTNDDFLGAAVAQNLTAYTYPDNTHVIMDGTNLNGRATIVYHP